MIEGRHGTDDTDHHGHRVRIAAETAVEVAHLLVDHRVICDRVLEILEGCRVGQLTVQQQVANFQEAAFLGKLLDGVAAMAQDADFAVDIGQGRVTTRRRGVGGVIGEHARLGIQLPDINHLRAFGAFKDRKFNGLPVYGKGRGTSGFCFTHVNLPQQARTDIPTGTGL